MINWQITVLKRNMRMPSASFPGRGKGPSNTKPPPSSSAASPSRGRAAVAEALCQPTGK